ncbi:MAG TPA: glycerol-3-phosphate 1-O-acyltransferase PlsY [Thermoanaerobaculia bacterium]|nr:glycerol-3-phosphate 1-O-acyltransferase PlsY [Thermoanaerobaculia bacterium]
MRFAIGILVLAYLLGSIPFSWLIVKLRAGKDVRTVGSGNVGATNAMRAAGKAAGISALLLDIAKGVAAVLIARRLGSPPALVGAAAFFAMLGHCYPVWLKFQGGKGVATSAGAMGALAPPAMVLTLLVFLATVALKRYVSLGSIAAAGSFPLFVLATQRLGWEHRDPWLLVSAALIGLFIIWNHRSNLERIRQGIEPRIGERRAG